MKSNFFLLFFISCLISLSSCRNAFDTVVEVDLPKEEPRLVPNAFLQPDSLFTVEVTNSKFVLDSASTKPILNAEVKVFENGILLATLINYGNGVYKGISARPFEGRIYDLTVSAPGYPECSGKAFIPYRPVIKNLTFRDSTYSNNNTFYGEINLKFDDPGSENYYLIEVVTFDSLLETYIPVGFLKQQDSDIHSEDNFTTRLFFSDEKFNGRTHEIRLYLPANGGDAFIINNPDSIINPVKKDYYLFFWSVSKSYYNYTLTKDLQFDTQGNPFSEPVPVYSNSSSKMGIFAGKSLTKERIVK